jgi:glycosyltransferase involved in cell wall biosynthesis
VRIGISTSVIARGRSGIGQYVLALVRALLAHPAGHEYVLFVLESDRKLFEFAEGRAQIVIVPERFRSPLKDILWHQTRLRELVHQLGIDVLHVPSYRRLLWGGPCALVGTVHDLAAFSVENKYDWTRMFYGRVVARSLVWRQDKVIAISQTTAHDINKFFRLPKNRISVVHNGVEHSRFFPAPQKRFKHDAPCFLYVSRLEHPAKNHWRLIQAFNQFKQSTRSNWKLVLAGSDWHGAEVIHRAAKESPFADDIHMLGFVSDAELPDLYRAADVFVYPSLYEGFGMPPVEAMACGCPAIVSPRGALAEVVGDAAYIVNPEQIDSIRLAMERVATDPVARERLRNAGLEQARKYHWKRAARETLHVYETAHRERLARQQPALIPGFQREMPIGEPQLNRLPTE